ncbi:hypothetical protein B5X24_HaOG207671 [Helicoverpa armigera]|uniref:Uncharacterized protein n=1 Tax=Helicoverpa armigera TaxID=29058 RepID=A0A2W1BHI4_HELAM|nr:hypothetical protein B5X24_HaOG207671 [Helicoverpa armigera]
MGELIFSTLRQVFVGEITRHYSKYNPWLIRTETRSSKSNADDVASKNYQQQVRWVVVYPTLDKNRLKTKHNHCRAKEAKDVTKDTNSLPAILDIINRLRKKLLIQQKPH